MSKVFMCDCCKEVLDVDEKNEIVEPIVAWVDGEEYDAEDDVCDSCLEEIMDQRGFDED